MNMQNEAQTESAPKPRRGRPPKKKTEQIVQKEDGFQIGKNSEKGEQSSEESKPVRQKRSTPARKKASELPEKEETAAVKRKQTVKAETFEKEKAMEAAPKEKAEPVEKTSTVLESPVQAVKGTEARAETAVEIRQTKPISVMSAAPSRLSAQHAQARNGRNLNPAANELLRNGECGDCCGILDIRPEGFGFLRSTQFRIEMETDQRDVYVSAAQIRRFHLRSGDMVRGKTRPIREGEKYRALLFVGEVNGQSPEIAAARVPFEDLIPIYPQERLRLEGKSNQRDLAVRLIDLIAPIGKGQRGMIVAPPKAGKTIMLKKLANAISENYPEAELIVLLIDERPEEVTDMQRSIKGDVIYSTFDERPENHAKIAELVLERAKRLVEQKKDVVILLDSLTRLARAYNLVTPPTGRTLSGGLDPGALYTPKRFFGAARNIENGGSLTIIATALVETGSRMDEIIFEEFKGTGNMEIRLDRRLQEKRIFPAIDISKSSTRREELLMTSAELNGMWSIRKLLSRTSEEMATEQLLSLLSKAETNEIFLQRLQNWFAAVEKEGFQLVK